MDSRLNSANSTAIAKTRINEINRLQALIQNDPMDKRRTNDIVLDSEDTGLGHKIVNIERTHNNKTTSYEILLDSEDKIIFGDRKNMYVHTLGDDDEFFVVSYDIYTKGENTKGNYIKDIKKDKVITKTLEGNITNIKHNPDLDLYLITTRNENFDESTKLFDANVGIIDKGIIKMLEKNLYVNRVGRYDDHEQVRDVFFKKIERGTDGNCTITELFQGLETPSDYETHKDNYFNYIGDGIVIEGAPRGGKNVPTPCHIYKGEFGQATDIFSQEKRHTPEYTGKLYSISKDLFGVRPQVFPRGDSIYEPRNKKFRAPYISFVTFDGTEISKKPYCNIKKYGDIVFAKFVNKSMIKKAKLEKTTQNNNTQESASDNEYLENEALKGMDKLLIIDPKTLDPIDDNEYFINIKENIGFVECTKENEEIVIYKNDGTRKAENILSYKSLQDEIFECKTLGGGKEYYDNKWNKIDL